MSKLNGIVLRATDSDSSTLWMSELFNVRTRRQKLSQGKLSFAQALMLATSGTLRAVASGTLRTVIDGVGETQLKTVSFQLFVPARRNVWAVRALSQRPGTVQTLGTAPARMRYRPAFSSSSFLTLLLLFSLLPL